MFIEYEENSKHKSNIGDTSRQSENIDDFTDCGYILKDNEVVVDIDHLDKRIIRAMLDEFDIKTQVVWTDRGCHLYFRRPPNFNRATGIVPLGFEVEYKVNNNKKEPKSVTIKRNGVTRPIENEGERESLPFILTTGHGKHNFLVLQGYSEGDGRNNALRDLKFAIGNHGDYKKVLKFVNNYIFAEPLSEAELKTVSRAEDFTGKKDQEGFTADIIAKEHKIVKYTGQLFFNVDGVYFNDPDKLNRLVYSYCPNVKTNYIDEVVKQMDYRCKLIDKEKENEFVVRCNNGVFKDGHFIECDFQEFTPYTIDIDFDPNAEPVPAVDEYLNQLTNGDEGYKQLIGEILGHILITDKDVKRSLARFFIFVGDGGNGKGTLLQVIKKIFGSQNCSALSIQNMSDERYLCVMQGRLCNLGDDLEDQNINQKQLKNLKNLSSCDPIEIRRMYHNSETVELSLSLIFTSNHVLKSFEKGDSFKRRILWLPMYSKPKKVDKWFLKKITTPEALKYWLRLASEGYSRLYENVKFSTSKRIREFNKDYHYDNDSTIAYVECLDYNEIDGKKPKALYDDYKIWAEDEGLNILSQKTFEQTVRDLKGFIKKRRRINGSNPTWVFTKVEE